MREFLAVCWGIMAGLNGLATGLAVVAMWVNGASLAYCAGAAFGGAVSVIACLTVMFVVDNVGKGAAK